jgi:hypothetical protein
VLTREQLIMLLSQADMAWVSVHGTYHRWRRQALVEVAFELHLRPLSAAGSGIASLTARRDGGDRDPIIESVLTVAADRHGQRRRADAVSRSGEEWLADTVVVDHSTFWARTGTSVTTNGGDPHSSHGGADFVALLLPSRMLAGFDLASTGELEEVAGRRCVVASASPREPDPYGRTPGCEVFDMIAGGSHFRLSIDLPTGVLLKVIKLVDGEIAELCEFTKITIDEPLDDSLFAPLL